MNFAKLKVFFNVFLRVPRRHIFVCKAFLQPLRHSAPDFGDSEEILEESKAGSHVQVVNTILS